MEEEKIVTETTEVVEEHSEETTSTETSTEPAKSDLLPGQQEGEDIQAYASRIAKEKNELEEKNRQLYARTKKAEKSEKKSEDYSNIEVIQFFATGGTKEDYQRLQVIMAGSNISFEEAQKDPMYLAYREKNDRERKDQQAQVRSKSSSASTDSEFRSGLTPEQHKELWKKMTSK